MSPASVDVPLIASASSKFARAFVMLPIMEYARPTVSSKRCLPCARTGPGRAHSCAYTLDHADHLRRQAIGSRQLEIRR